MATLDPETRNILARKIQDARRVAEDGARRALDALAVGSRRAHPTMTASQVALRVRLRSHGRQLGDIFDEATETQSTSRLAHEVAYEHWHRMLFARFLAENHLLLEPDSGVPISLDECRDLAREQGTDPWVAAAAFAQGMLPEIFRAGDPSLDVDLPIETRVALEAIVEDLPAHVFTSDDALGWTYQYWQAEKKDEVNKSGVKIGATELPAVTQLFTEHYMVLFLLHNTIGAWRAGRVLAQEPELASKAVTERDLRQALRITAGGGYEFEYLRFVRESRPGEDAASATGPWRPAAGTFAGWPGAARDLRILDPCCGSGHFLQETLRLLASLRAEEEGLAYDAAIKAVLGENLFGLEIDPRCTQLAAFALALAAGKSVGKWLHLPRLNVACSGLAPNAKKEEWVRRGGENDRLRGGMARLYDLFNDAPLLGSLIDPRSIGSRIHEANFAEMEPSFEKFVRDVEDPDGQERAVAAAGMARAAGLMAARYHLVATNVPYLGRGNQNDALRAFSDNNYPDSRADLATVFLSRALRWTRGSGTVAFVMPQNWLFQPAYATLRVRALSEVTINILGRLGTRAFQTPMWDFNVCLVALTQNPPSAGSLMSSIDASSCQSWAEKADYLSGKEDSPGSSTSAIAVTPQSDQLSNPDSRIIHGNVKRGALLDEYASFHNGIQTGDFSRYGRQFWEFPSGENRPWRILQGTVAATTEYGGLDCVIRTDNDGNLPTFGAGAVVRGTSAWGRPGVAVSAMGNLYVTLYTGEFYNDNVVTIIPEDPTNLPAVWAFLSSPSYRERVREIDQALKVRGALVKVPFDLPYWRKAAMQVRAGRLPEPESDDPTQWLFHGHPAASIAPLQVAVARLLGYIWPVERDEKIRVSERARDLCDRAANLASHADQDGIVTLQPLRGQDAGADRLRRLLAASYGEAWSAKSERDLLAQAQSKSVTLEGWLLAEFFDQHCKLFSQRPFIWHVWDGRKDGFNALVNYHKLAGTNGRRTLEALTYGYLGEWIERQRQQQREGSEGSDARLVAATDLQNQLANIIEGETPYDIFARWRSLPEQAVGWNPDIDDGVRVNIRPFMTAELRAGGRKGAGLLRSKPSIHWEKDRGTEMERPRQLFPWFWSLPKDEAEGERTDFVGGAKFDGNRWNNLHYTKAAKQAARERHAAKGGTS